MKNTILLLSLLLSSCNANPAFTKDSCQDPNKLNPELKKAYYQLKSAGINVSIKCY